MVGSFTTEKVVIAFFLVMAGICIGVLLMGSLGVRTRNFFIVLAIGLMLFGIFTLWLFA